MSGIFISYRRNDSQSAAGRLADFLERSFGRDQIFRDVETIEPGADFVHAIEKAIASCQVMLVVIGPRWLTIADNEGHRRLDKPDDWIRLETFTALKRDVRLIPVLVEDAQPPAATDLPDDLKGLARREAHELSDKRWDYDVQQLIAALERIPGIRRRVVPPVPPQDNKTVAGTSSKSSKIIKTLAWIGGIFVALVVIGLFMDKPTAPSVPLAQALPPGAPTSSCGCWGPVMAGATRPNPRCVSSMDMAILCGGGCPAGGSPWQSICK